MEHTFGSEANPLIGPKDGSLTAAEIRELVAYARSYHVELVPEQQTFGHLHKALRLEKYADLGETPYGDVLSPQQPGTILPGDISSAGSLALIDIQEGKADDARKRYEKMLEKDPKNEQLLLALADVTAMTRPNPEEAKAVIDKAISANPQSARPRLALVGYYGRVGDARAALNAAQAAQSLFPNDPQVIDAVGTAELASGATNQGLATYARLAQMEPQHVDRPGAPTDRRHRPGVLEKRRHGDGLCIRPFAI